MAGESYGPLHISQTPIPVLKDDFPIQPGIYFKFYGKPQGFWYTTGGLTWPEILEELLEANEGSIQQAIRTSLGYQPAINNRNSPANKITSEAATLYVYDVNIPEDKKTVDVKASDPTKILVLSQDNLEAFLKEHWNTFYQSQLIPALFYNIKFLMDPMFAKITPLSMYNFILRLVSICASLEGEGYEAPPWEAPMREVDLTSATEITKFLNKNIGTIKTWITEQLTHNKAPLSEMLMRYGAGPFQEFWPRQTYKQWPLNKFKIEEMIWNGFWTQYFPPLFGGVEFDESVLYLMGGKNLFTHITEGVPLWAKTLDFPSGCLFRPSAIGVTLSLKVKVGLDPSVKNVDYNVYGVRRANKLIIRTHNAPAGGGRTRRRGRKRSRASRKK